MSHHSPATLRFRDLNPLTPPHSFTLLSTVQQLFPVTHSPSISPTNERENQAHRRAIRRRRRVPNPLHHLLSRTRIPLARLPSMARNRPNHTKTRHDLLCYSTTPQGLSRRFPQLESLKIKGQPRAAMFNLIPEDWGGYAKPWVEEIAECLPRIKTIHLRRMIVTDSDLEVLAVKVGSRLEVLKLDRCSGFSTGGLLVIVRLCRNMRNLFLEESSINENGGEWLHELALNNTVLEHLNFYLTDLQVRSEDLELIARRCPSLVSMKISDSDITELVGFFQAAASLEEFRGGSVEALNLFVEGEFNGQREIHWPVVFPSRLCGLGLTYLEEAQMTILHPIASRLKKLDLLYAMLDTESHCFLLQRCPNLEVLETRAVIGDSGLEVLGQFCKKMKRLRIERGADGLGPEGEQGSVTQIGLVAIAQGCLEMEHLAVYVSDITNESLECIGTYSKRLYDFRLVLLDREVIITDLPLDNGVRALLVGCQRLKRFALYLRHGGLTDKGLSYIGRYSPNVSWMLLGYVGESDEGLLEFSRGCPSLLKLEIRGCCFSERALATASLQLASLRYLWVQGYRSSGNVTDLLQMVRPYWNIELITRYDCLCPTHLLAYYSLSGPRTDMAATVEHFEPSMSGFSTVQFPPPGFKHSPPPGHMEDID